MTANLYSGFSISRLNYVLGDCRCYQRSTVWSYSFVVFDIENTVACTELDLDTVAWHLFVQVHSMVNWLRNEEGCFSSYIVAWSTLLWKDLSLFRVKCQLKRFVCIAFREITSTFHSYPAWKTPLISSSYSKGWKNSNCTNVGEKLEIKFWWQFASRTVCRLVS
jgi:hypothetical protein